MPFSDRPDLSQALARPDLAELALEGVVRAADYRATQAMQAIAPVIDIRASRAPRAHRLDVLLFGEIFDVLEVVDGMAWGRSRRSGVVGYATVDPLDAAILLPTHTVVTARAGDLPMNALVTVESVSGDTARAARAGDLPMNALRPIGVFAADAAEAAEVLIDAPYALGGGADDGLDDRGLVRQALMALGRDACSFRATSEPRRGDLAVWPTHVGVMADADHIIHASASLGAVVVEPLARLVGRLDASPAFRRA